MKNEKIRIIFEQDFASIEQFKGEVAQTAAHLNEICNHVQARTKTEILEVFRNSEAVVRELSMKKDPVLRRLSDKNPNILIPIDADLEIILKQIQSLDIPMVDCLSYTGSKWIINEERMEHECDRYRDIIVNEDQLERLNVAKVNSDYLNKLPRSERDFLLNKVGNLQYMVIQGDPNIISDSNDTAKFRPNPAFVLGELKDNYHTSRDLDTGVDLRNMGELINTEQRDREPSRLPKNLTDRQRKKLEADAIIYHVARSM